MKTALVLGGGGFIGSHVVKRLKKEGFWVRAVDLKKPSFSITEADDFILGDLRFPSVISKAMYSPKQISMNDIDNSFDEVYQLAADMGGAGYIFTGENDANVMSNSVQINLLVCQYASMFNVKRVFYSSSACMYPAYNQEDPLNPKCNESSAYPAAPDSEYGWEKLFSERLYLAYNRNYNLQVRIGRYHNIYGPEGTYDGGKEKAPAALCRKIASIEDGGTMEVWGSGNQTRSFLYIDDCVDATINLTRSNFMGPVNIGSEEMISINDFAKMIIEISNKKINIKNIPGPIGVNGRNSDNRLIESELGWKPKYKLKDGITLTYNWILDQLKNKL
jgi:nucleoside-diphosphate-sugar epimerase